VFKNFRVFFVCVFAVLFAVWAPSATSQPERGPVAVKSELQLVGGFSVGNIHLFGYADDRQIYPFGLEYDRHSFGGLIGSKVDYVAEFLPVVLVNEPAKYGTDGHALTTDRKIQYGIGLTPVGARMMWRKPGQIQPYLIGKGGVLYFTDRILSSEGSHVQFSGQFGVGIQKALSNRFGYRLAYNDFHFSNGDIARHNPGIDFMEIQAGLTFRLMRR
jgi:Lipid A 3-O-deacylase (PagL)